MIGADAAGWFFKRAADFIDLKIVNKEEIKKVAFYLEKTIDGYIRVEDFAYHHYRYHYGIPDLKKSSLSQALKRLREEQSELRKKIKEESKINKDIKGSAGSNLWIKLAERSGSCVPGVGKTWLARLFPLLI